MEIVDERKKRIFLFLRKGFFAFFLREGKKENPSRTFIFRFFNDTQKKLCTLDTIRLTSDNTYRYVL